MLDIRPSRLLLSFVYTLMVLIPKVYAHEHHGHAISEMAPPAAKAVNSTVLGTDYHALDSYYLWKEDKMLLYSHIVTMVISWVFVLPFVLAFNLSRSPLYYPTQLAFVGGNFLGVVCSMMYNVRTPDLYPNNVHHKLGLMIIGLLTIHTIMGMIWRRSSGSARSVGSTKKLESSYTPLYTSTDEEEELDDLVVSPPRVSGDSGLGAERSSSSEHSTELGHDHNHHRDRDSDSFPQVICSTRMGSFLQRHAPYMFTPTVMRVNDLFSSLVIRLLPIIGFVQITAGLVVITGIFVGSNVLNGLAHTVKGGIFFWYGVLTFGRFLGAFGEYGWAWNIRPLSNSKWAKRVPSCEMVESSLILFYGTIDVFLEHLAAWGHAWTHMDLEHESIAILFFGGGLCGVLLESKAVRDLLYLNPQDDEDHSQYMQPSHETFTDHRAPRRTKATYNILPSLVLFLLGRSMSGHHQSSSLSVAMHTQWGQLLSYAGVARVATYVLLYISPPRSTVPSRPPTEVVAAFCLMAGGLIFMLSNKDSIAGFEKYGYEESFIFTLISALTAFLMGWITVFMAIKGWRMRRAQGK
ncbi:integral membrane protein-like protein [Tirmania nivea]|nr:integral membrane protein-like protein [Tirmania nivea]